MLSVVSICLRGVGLRTGSRLTSPVQGPSLSSPSVQGPNPRHVQTCSTLSTWTSLYSCPDMFKFVCCTVHTVGGRAVAIRLNCVLVTTRNEDGAR